jgi:hypothetical protein
VKLAFIIATSVVSVLLPISIAHAADNSAWSWRLTLTESKNGHEMTLVDPSMTVREGEPASISITEDGQTYSFKVTIDSEQGRLIARTIAKITDGTQIISAPRITAFAGESASLNDGKLTFRVDTHASNGAK